jgi:hypothetical protein
MTDAEPRNVTRNTMRIERLTEPRETFTHTAEHLQWSSLLDTVSADIPLAIEALHASIHGHQLYLSIRLEAEPRIGGRLVIDTTQEHIEYSITIEEEG